jgi:hypothetical protein
MAVAAVSNASKNTLRMLVVVFDDPELDLLLRLTTTLHFVVE